MAKFTIQRDAGNHGDWLVLTVSKWEKRLIADREDRDMLFPERETQKAWPLRPVGPPVGPFAPGSVGRVRSASVVPHAYQALGGTIPAWRLFPPHAHHLHISEPKVLVTFSWDTETLAIVYGIHKPAVLVEVDSMPRRLVITVDNPSSIVESIQSKLD